jgi:hypothetical protein
VIPVWGDYDRNIYYNPEKCGATMIGDVRSARSYEFDIIIIVQRNSDGTLWAAHDAGCSCPTPFENVHGWGDMFPVRSMDEFERFVSENAPSYEPYSMADVFALRRTVRKALERPGDQPPLALRRQLGPGLGIGKRG